MFASNLNEAKNMAVLSPIPHDYTRPNTESNVLSTPSAKSTLMINSSQSCENSSSEAHQGEPQSPIQIHGANTIPSRFINRMVRREGFAHRSSVTIVILVLLIIVTIIIINTLIIILIIIISGSGSSSRSIIIIIRTIFIIITSTSLPLSISSSSSSSSLSSPSLLQLFGTKTC